jgi:hypothetical protein
MCDPTDLESFAPRTSPSGAQTETEQEYIARVGPALPNLPEDVLGQWLYDHWRFAISRYSELHLATLTVEMIELNVDAVPSTSIGNDSFVHSLANGVYSRDHLPPRADRVRQHFLEHGTWPRPPIFLANESPDERSASWWGTPLHLVEGHNRLGCLLRFRSDGRSLRPSHAAWRIHRGTCCTPAT